MLDIASINFVRCYASFNYEMDNDKTYGVATKNSK